MVGGGFLGTNTIYWSTMVSTLNLIPPNPRLTKGKPAVVDLVPCNIVPLLLDIHSPILILKFIFRPQATLSVADARFPRQGGW